MLLEGTVIKRELREGSQTGIRLGGFGELITGEMAGKYFELAKQGRLFMASMQAGASLGTALTGTAVTFTLYNPSGGGIIVTLLQCAIAITTEPTAGAGAKSTLVYAASPNPASAIPATVTELVVRPGLIGGNTSGVAKAYSAATFPAAPVVVRIHPLSINNQTAVGGVPLAAVDYVDGGLCLAANTAVTIQGIGTAVSGIVSMLWGEVPI